jgi:hypothetical protein
MKMLLDRWQIGAITQLRSGMPIDIVAASGNGRSRLPRERPLILIRSNGPPTAV